MGSIFYVVIIGVLAHDAVGQGGGRLSAFQALDDLRQIPGNSLSAIISAMASAVPGQTYPTLSSIPDTAFACSQVKQAGYYADPDTGCQVFRQCLTDGSIRSYICTNQSLFNQITLVCDWWFNVNCQKASSYYDYSNPRIYQQNMRFLDDNGSGASGADATGQNSGPPAAVIFPLPGSAQTSNTQQRRPGAASLRIFSTRPVGRSLTSPLSWPWNIDKELFGGAKETTGSAGQSATVAESGNDPQVIKSPEKHISTRASDMPVIQGENEQSPNGQPLIEEHEIRSISDDHNLRPADALAAPQLRVKYEALPVTVAKQPSLDKSGKISAQSNITSQSAHQTKNRPLFETISESVAPPTQQTTTALVAFKSVIESPRSTTAALHPSSGQTTPAATFHSAKPPTKLPSLTTAISAPHPDHFTSTVMLAITTTTTPRSKGPGQRP